MPPPDPAEPEPVPAAAGLRGRLFAGDLLVGMMVVEFFTPALPGILARAGLDFAVFDMETSGLTFERLELLTALSRAAGLAPLVRVPSASPDTVGRCLDLGAVGVMAPKVRDAAEAAELAQLTRYPPTGSRGSGYTAYPSGYVTATGAADRTSADAATLTICQLETPDAIDQADRIAAIPGIDVLNVGANDLAAALGVAPGHTEVSAAVDRVSELCDHHGKAYLGRASSTSATHQPQRRMVLIDHDTAALSAHTTAGVRAVRKELSP